MVEKTKLIGGNLAFQTNQGVASQAKNRTGVRP
jgi:hypothetical protein